MRQAHRFVTRGAVATLQAMALAGISVVGLMMFFFLVTAGSLIGVGVGLFLLPPLVVMTQRLTTVQRRLASRWCGVRISVPYRPSPPNAGASPVRHVLHLFGDRANWRDALWLLVDGTIGVLLTSMPLGLILHGIRGLAMPFGAFGRWLGSWYAFVPMTGSTTKLIAALLGLAQFPLALWVA